MPVRQPVRKASPARRATEERILDAFEVVLLRDGMRNLSLNAVVAEAGVGKPMLYRYFGDLAGVVRAWGERRTMFVDPDPGNRPPDPPDADLKDVIESDLVRNAEFLRTHPVTLEFLAEELTGRSSLSEAFNGVRDQVRRSSVRRMTRDSRYMLAENRRLALIIYAAITHLALRARYSPSFFGIDLASDMGWQQIMAMVAGLFEDARLAEKARAAGLDLKP